MRGYCNLSCDIFWFRCLGKKLDDLASDRSSVCSSDGDCGCCDKEEINKECELSPEPRSRASRSRDFVSYNRYGLRVPEPRFRCALSRSLTACLYRYLETHVCASTTVLLKYLCTQSLLTRKKTPTGEVVVCSSFAFVFVRKGYRHSFSLVVDIILVQNHRYVQSIKIKNHMNYR